MFYNTIAEAKQACDLDSGCQAVFDVYCDGGAGYGVYLCPIGTAYEYGATSCIYEKGKLLSFVAKLFDQNIVILPIYYIFRDVS